MRGNGVGVGVGDCCDLERLYFICPRAIDPTKTGAHTAITIALVIKLFCMDNNRSRRVSVRGPVAKQKRFHDYQLLRAPRLPKTSSHSATAMATKSSQVV